MNTETYVRLVTGLSAGIALGALWLVSLMIARTTILRELSGADVAAIVYVGGTVAVFGIIALRYGAQINPVIVLVILGLKLLSVWAIAGWVWRRMRSERL